MLKKLMCILMKLQKMMPRCCHVVTRVHWVDFSVLKGSFKQGLFYWSKLKESTLKSKALWDLLPILWMTREKNHKSEHLEKFAELCA